MPIFVGSSPVQFQLGAFANGSKRKLEWWPTCAVRFPMWPSPRRWSSDNHAEPRSRLYGWWGTGRRAGACCGSRAADFRTPRQVALKADIGQNDPELIGEAWREAGAAAPILAATVPIPIAALALGRVQLDTALVMAMLHTMPGSGSRRDRRA